jgi:hypothetical protein
MGNGASFDAGKIAYDMASFSFKADLEPEEEDKPTEKEGHDESSAELVVPEDLLQSYAGRYILSGMGLMLEYSVKDGILKMNMEGQPETTLTPLSQSEFTYEGLEASVLFETDDQGKVTGAVHTQGGQDYKLEAVPPYDSTLDDLQALTGRYFSKELDVFYNLVIRDSTLVILLRNSPEIKLSAIKEDVYKGDVFFIGEVEFLRDNAGRAMGFKASNGRTRGIGFERL